MTGLLYGCFSEKQRNINHSHSWFPHLGSRSNYVKQSANLWDLKGLIQGDLVRQMDALEQPVHLVDGFPMSVCKIIRAYGSHRFKGEAAYGYCAAKDEKYYGFEGHVLISSEGVFAAIRLPPPTWTRGMCSWIRPKLRGLLIGDKGYIRPGLKEELAK